MAGDERQVKRLTTAAQTWPKRAGLLAQIEACRREVAQWPEWMRATSTVPKRM
jgi:hypothetical protein